MLKFIRVSLVAIFFWNPAHADFLSLSSTKTIEATNLTMPVSNGSSVFIIARSIDSSKPIFLYESNKDKTKVMPIELLNKITFIQREILLKDGEIFFLGLREDNSNWGLYRLRVSDLSLIERIDLGRAFYAMSLTSSDSGQLIVGGEQDMQPMIKMVNVASKSVEGYLLGKKQQGVVRKVLATSYGYAALVGKPYGNMTPHSIQVMALNKKFISKKILHRETNYLCDITSLDGKAILLSYLTSALPKPMMQIEKISDDLTKVVWKREVDSPPVGLYHYDILSWKNQLWVIGSAKLLAALYLNENGLSKAIELDKGGNKGVPFAVPPSGYSSIIHNNSLQVFFGNSSVGGGSEIVNVLVPLGEWSPVKASAHR